MEQSGEFGYRRVMKVFALPLSVRGIVFDIDNTLYRHEEYVRQQIDLLIRRLAHERGERYEDTRQMIEDFRAQEAAKNDGRKPSLGNAFLHFGVPIETSVRWREEELHPEEYLGPDPELAALLERISTRFRLCCVTNNPQAVGRRTLRALTLESSFPVVIGLDDSGVSKPHVAPFLSAAKLLSLEPAEMVSIGDRYEVDLEPAMAVGMGGILVESREDLFDVPLWAGGE